MSFILFVFYLVNLAIGTTKVKIKKKNLIFILKLNVSLLSDIVIAL